MSSYHRIVWIDSQIREEKYPNCSKIAKEFEISTRQASRDIEYLRYTMGAPIEYSTKKNGYGYSDHTFVLPAVFITEEEKETLNYLSYHYQNMGDDLTDRIAELFSRITGETSKYTYQKRKIPVLNLSSKEVKVYRELKNAIEDKKKTNIKYINSKNETSSRILCPYKVFMKGRNSYIVGYCEMRNELRVFRLSRIREVLILNENFEISPSFNETEFGEKTIFHFYDPYEATIQLDSPPDKLKINFQYEIIKNDLYKIEFYKSDDLLSFLLTSNTNFKIISPDWLKEKLKSKIIQIIQKNF